MPLKIICNKITHKITKLQIAADDGLPQFICHGCVGRLAATTAFRHEIHRAQQMLAQHFQAVQVQLNDNAGPEEEVIIIEDVYNKALLEPIERLEEDDDGPINIVEDVVEMIDPIDNNSNSAAQNSATLIIAETQPDDPRPYPCHICRKTFQSVSNRNTHLQSHNQGTCISFLISFLIFAYTENSYKCGECGQGFKSKVYVNKHIKSVHTVAYHECTQCAAQFDSTAKYEYHMKSHDPNKKYKCKYCEKSFLQHHHLSNHERTHTGIRPFLCNICGKGNIFYLNILVRFIISSQ